MGCERCLCCGCTVHTPSWPSTQWAAGAVARRGCHSRPPTPTPLNPTSPPRPCPSLLPQLTGLRRLELQYNGFEGGPPAVVGELTTLEELNLGGNLWGSSPHTGMAPEYGQLRCVGWRLGWLLWLALGRAVAEALLLLLLRQRQRGAGRHPASAACEACSHRPCTCPHLPHTQHSACGLRTLPCDGGRQLKHVTLAHCLLAAAPGSVCAGSSST